MIDYEQLRPLLQALEDDVDPEHHRLLIEALVALPLAPSAWQQAAPAIHQSLNAWSPGFDAPTSVGLMARIPFRSMREKLRQRASRPGTAEALVTAMALADVGDVAGMPTLLRQLRTAPNPDVAQALAQLPLESTSLAAEDLEAGLLGGTDAGDQLTTMWTAIAVARVGDLEPLEQLWDALARRPEFFERSTRGYLFREPPPLFHGNPARTVGELAHVRPLPDRVERFILGLRANDYDEQWKPRDATFGGEARNPILFMAGLTGRCDQYGDPLPSADDPAVADSARAHGATSGDEAAAMRIAIRLRETPWRELEPNADQAELILLRHAPAELAAEVVERGVEQLDVARVERAEVPPFALGNALVSLAAALPRDIPIRIGRALARPLLELLPVTSVAWSLARAGATGVLRSLVPLIAASEGGERTRWLTWLGHLARELDAPAPFLGAGGEEKPPPPVIELVDDLPRKMARAPSRSAEMPGSVKSIPSEERADAGAEEEMSRSAPSSAGDPGNKRSARPAATREVFPDIATETPHPVAGTPLTLTVSLSTKGSATTRGSVHVPSTDPDATHTLQVHLLMGDVSAWDTLDFSLGAGTTQAATFALTTPSINARQQLVEARVNFYLNHRWCGEGSRNLDVRQSADVAAMTEIPLPPAPPWRSGLALDVDATPPDLIVRIQRSGSIGEYTWSCQSPHVALTPPADPADARMALGEDAAAFVRRTFGPLANVPLGRLNIGTIQGVGESIYRSAPAHFKDSYWAVWDAAAAGGFPFQSIQIVTDEPFVPWELMRIFDSERGAGVKADFLAIRHSVGRWLASESSGPPQRIPVSDVVVSASDYTGVAAVGNTLPWAKTERERLVTSHHARVVPLTSDTVLELLEEGHAQAVHFACHGRMSIADPNASQLVMEDTPNDVTPPLVARAEVCEGLGKNHPLVFLNACEVGGAAASLSLVAGFPAAFLYAGASALVSPLWVVNDERAASIAQEFYDAVLTPGGTLPIGEFLRTVRARWAQEKHLTYLAYVLYGDPLAWIDYTPPDTNAPQQEEP